MLMQSEVIGKYLVSPKYERNWHNLFSTVFIFKNQPIKSLFSSIQAHFALSICAFAQIW